MAEPLGGDPGHRPASVPGTQKKRSPDSTRRESKESPETVLVRSPSIRINTSPAAAASSSSLRGPGTCIRRMLVLGPRVWGALVIGLRLLGGILLDLCGGPLRVRVGATPR